MKAGFFKRDITSAIGTELPASYVKNFAGGVTGPLPANIPHSPMLRINFHYIDISKARYIR